MSDSVPSQEPIVAGSVSKSSETPFPHANIKSFSDVSAGMRSKLWWIALLCSLVSLGLFWYAKQGSGELIIIDFGDSCGLKPEDRMKYRGVEIGAVEKIELNRDQNGVSVHVRMTPLARSMAAEGARFWVVRPSVSLDSIQGLDTILGAKYLAMEPASSGAKIASRFQGLESSPIATPREGSLEIFLDASTRGGLESNAPVLYRGFRIGQVVQVGFASDARTVQARCAIDPEYRDLVRKNSKFWNRSGWRLDVGLTGIKLDADTLAQMMTGGVEVATPTDPDQNVSTGHRFKLYDKPDSDWNSWQPSLAHGQAWNRVATGMPQPIRIAMRWQERSFGFRKNQQIVGWCLPLSDGKVLCLSEQTIPPKSALPDSLVFELAGQSIPGGQLSNITAGATELANSAKASRFSTHEPLPSDVVRWPTHLVAETLPDKVCDVFLAHPDSNSVLPIASARLTVSEQGWIVDDMITLGLDYHGIPVLSAESSKVIGLVVLFKGKATVVAP